MFAFWGWVAGAIARVPLQGAAVRVLFALWSLVAAGCYCKVLLSERLCCCWCSLCSLCCLCWCCAASAAPAASAASAAASAASAAAAGSDRHRVATLRQKCIMTACAQCFVDFCRWFPRKKCMLTARARDVSLISITFCDLRNSLASPMNHCKKQCSWCGFSGVMCLVFFTAPATKDLPSAAWCELSRQLATSKWMLLAQRTPTLRYW